MEAIPAKRATDKVIINFLQDNILSRFGFPRKLVTDNALAFKSKNMINFCEENKIILKHSTPYYGDDMGRSFAVFLNDVANRKALGG